MEVSSTGSSGSDRGGDGDVQTDCGEEKARRRRANGKRLQAMAALLDPGVQVQADSRYTRNRICSYPSTHARLDNGERDRTQGSDRETCAEASRSLDGKMQRCRRSAVPSSCLRRYGGSRPKMRTRDCASERERDVCARRS